MALAFQPLLLAQETAGEVLLLRTGGVLRGQIERQGDHYVVTTADREIRLLARDVESVCRSLTEAYSIQRAALIEDSPADHITLAQWCIRHNLWAAAARELLDARRLDPEHPRLAMTEQRLALAARPKKDPPQSSSPSPGKEACQTGQRTGVEVDRITQLSYETSPGTGPLMAVPHQEPLSEEVLKQFTESIQPLLLNTCTTSGCHQVGGRERFQLDRSALGWTGNRRRTIRNLEATLDWIDREHPETSQLLVAATQAHGSLDSPSITVHQTQHRTKLRLWIDQICQQATPSKASIHKEVGFADSPPADPPRLGDDGQSGYENPVKDPLIRKSPKRGVQLRRVRAVDSADRRTDM
ncbi:MAG: hypothetical protein JW829_05360 [Pirellulales bacterium]|nr:hypothetical protein [Pirellulales bacterium]